MIMKISTLRALFLLATLLLMLAVPLYLGGSDTLTQVRQAAPSFLAALLALVMIKWLCTLWRWQLLLSHSGHRLSKKRLFAISLSIDFASENTPAASGGGAVLLWLFKREGIPLTTSISAAALFLSFDILAVVLLLSGILLYFLMQHGAALLWPAALGGSLLLLLLMLFVLLLRQPQGYASLAQALRLPRLLPTSLRRKASNASRQLAQHLIAASQLPKRDALSLVLLSLINWGARFSFLFMAIHTVGGDSSWVDTAIIQFVSTLAGLFTLLPGGYPGTDISITALLHSSEPMAIILSALLLWRLATYHVTFVAGLLAALWLWLHTDASDAAIIKNESP